MDLFYNVKREIVKGEMFKKINSKGKKCMETVKGELVKGADYEWI